MAVLRNNQGMLMRRYCWRTGTVVELAEGEPCPECGFKRHPPVPDQRRCCVYVPIVGDAGGTPCMLLAGHDGPCRGFVMRADWHEVALRLPAEQGSALRLGAVVEATLLVDDRDNTRSAARYALLKLGVGAYCEPLDVGIIDLQLDVLAPFVNGMKAQGWTVHVLELPGQQVDVAAVLRQWNNPSTEG